MHTYTPAAEDSANWSIGEGLEAIDLQSTGTTPTPSLKGSWDKYKMFR